MSESGGQPAGPELRYMTRNVVLCIVAVILFLAVVNFFPVRKTTAGKPPCVNQLHQIDYCKKAWAMDKNKGENDIPSWNDLNSYVASGWTNGIPVCPKGGVYVVGRVGENPTCSIAGQEHSMP